MDCSTPGFLSFTISRGLLKLMSIESVMPLKLLIFFSPLLLLPSIFSSIMVFSNESFLIGGQSIQISASTSVLLMNTQDCDDLFDLLAVQGTLKSLLQHHSSKAAVVWCSAFFTVQLSYPYVTTGKTTALTRWTFVGKVMSLAF